MKVIIQKSGYAKVEVDERIIGEINSGYVILLGITNGDTEKEIDYLIEKIANLRLFENEEKYFDKSIIDVNKEILLISQFTLYADCDKGRRPDFGNSAKSEYAKPLYENFIERLKAKNIKVSKGEFGAMMKVSLTNEGPITIILESNNQHNG